MNNTEIRAKIKDYSSQIEKNFMLLSDKFPTLLNKQGGTSLEEIRDVLTKLGDGNSVESEKEKNMLSGYGSKYSSLFDELNQRIKDLEEVNSHVKDIKSDSEEMELIALNAMVISIKSGEKGRAFSAITENLKRLSTDMILYSNNLISEEKQLLDSITSVQQIFGGIVDSQKQLSSLGSNGASGISNLIEKASQPLDEMKALTDSVYKPIQAAMEGIQQQDIIRQALDHVQLYLEQVVDTEEISSQASDQDLDNITFNITVLQLCERILNNVESALQKSETIFKNNWNNVTSILESVERQKNSYMANFLGDPASNPDSMLAILNSIIDKFQSMLGEFAHYQLVQKDLVRTCQNINEKARTMYAVFENLGPVVNRLHHVRILQQIEVAKNTAISDVRDSVTDMEKLIQSANGSLDNMRALIGNFIEQIGTLLSSFTYSIAQDNAEMADLRNSKNAYFNSLKDAEGRLHGCIQNFSVFPTGFAKECRDVSDSLNSMEGIQSKLSSFIQELHSRSEALVQERKQAFSERQISSWTIKDPKLIDIQNKFKAFSGQDGSVQRDMNDVGEITLF